jgi:hypothetical protein
MAIFVPGMSCSVCRKVIGEDEDPTLFPPFTGNEADELYLFNDAVVHEDCLARHPLRSKLELRMELFDRARPPYSCAVCTRNIRDPDEFVPLGFLSDDVTTPWYELNYAGTHRACLKEWPRLSALIAFVDSQIASGAWRGPGMTRFSAQLAALAKR